MTRTTKAVLNAGSAPKRGRGRSKPAKAPEYAEQLDFTVSPHLKGMTAAWQQLYAAVKQSVNN